MDSGSGPERQALLACSFNLCDLWEKNNYPGFLEPPIKSLMSAST